MTHAADQERAEFEAWLAPEYSREKWHTGEYTDDTVFSMFAAWQAARRAPAAPVPEWLRDLEWTVADHDRAGDLQNWCPVCGGCKTDYRDGVGGHKDGCELHAMLAAAPQPPEAVQSNSAEFDGIKTIAAALP